MQKITIPVDASGLIVSATETGTEHYISVSSQPKTNISKPILVVEIRKKGSATYETVENFSIGIDSGFRFVAPVDEYRFTVVGGEGCGIVKLDFKDTSFAGENDNSNLDTEVMDRLLSGDDYVGSNFNSLEELNATRASSQPMNWALVADNGSGSPGIAVSNGTGFVLLDSGGQSQEEILLEGLASGFLYVNEVEAG